MNSTSVVSRRFVTLTVCSMIALLSAVSSAEVRLPAIFGDNMVLQAGTRVSLWGWADPNEEINVRVSWSKVDWTIPADDQGRWILQTASPELGGPYEITVKGKNTITIKNVLVGEVWVCSGQSNMEMAVRSSANAEQEIAAANYPQIRLFTVEKQVAEEPQDDCKGKWVICSPETVGGFSAAGYFFGRELHKELEAPVGLINTSWGGTPAEAWTSPVALQENPGLEPILTRYKKALRGPAGRDREVQGKPGEVGGGRRARPRPTASSPPLDPEPPLGPDNPNSPAGLYNGMIAPLIPYAHPRRHLVPGRIERRPGLLSTATCSRTMIGDWRDDWGAGRLPLPLRAVAQLHGPAAGAVGDGRLGADLREAQTQDAGAAEHRHGRDHRHRRGQGHPPEEQAGRRPAAWPCGPWPRPTAR